MRPTRGELLTMAAGARPGREARHEMESAMIDWLIDSEDPARKPLQDEKR